MKNISINVLDEDISLKNFCIKYNVEIETISRKLKDEIEYYRCGKAIDNGKDLFYISERYYDCTIIKATGEKYILNTEIEEFPSEIRYEYFFDNDLVVSYDANEDCSLDFLFEFSSERSVGFFKTNF